MIEVRKSHRCLRISRIQKKNGHANENVKCNEEKNSARSKAMNGENSGKGGE